MIKLGKLVLVFRILPDPGLTALEVWCLAMIGLVFLAFLAYIVILAWLRTRLTAVSNIAKYSTSTKNIMGEGGWGIFPAYIVTRLIQFQNILHKHFPNQAL